MTDKDIAPLAKLIERCGKIAISKGFNPRLHATQISRIACETVEALDELYIPPTIDPCLRQYIYAIKDASYKFERHRANTDNRQPHFDDSIVADKDALLKELADICISAFTYIAANKMTDEFIYTLISVVDANELRPHKHNKRF